MVILEEGLKNLEWDEAEIQKYGEYLDNLRFADDIVLMSKSTDKPQQMILPLHIECGFKDEHEENYGHVQQLHTRL